MSKILELHERLALQYDISIKTYDEPRDARWDCTFALRAAMKGAVSEGLMNKVFDELDPEILFSPELLIPINNTLKNVSSSG